MWEKLSNSSLLFSKNYYKADSNFYSNTPSIHRLYNYYMYKGDYIKKIADDYINSKFSDRYDFESIKKFSVQSNLKQINDDLESIGVAFDNYISEKENFNRGLVEKVIEKLESQNDIYFGVLEKPKGKNDSYWKPIKQLLFRSSSYGDKTDRVIKKESGDITSFASDIA